MSGRRRWRGWMSACLVNGFQYIWCCWCWLLEDSSFPFPPSLRPTSSRTLPPLVKGMKGCSRSQEHPKGCDVEIIATLLLDGDQSAKVLKFGIQSEKGSNAIEQLQTTSCMDEVFEIEWWCGVMSLLPAEVLTRCRPSLWDEIMNNTWGQCHTMKGEIFVHLEGEMNAW